MTVTVEAELAGVGGGWTDITADAVKPIRLVYGITGNGVRDRVASTGTCTFRLRNSRSVSGGVAGYYSIGHPSCRVGWTYDIRIRLSVTDAGTTSRWCGYLDEAQAMPGRFGRYVSCTCVDYMDRLATAAGDSVAIQVTKTEVQCLTAILDAAPVQVATRSLQTAVDTYPYALDRQAETLLALAQDIAASCRGYVYLTRDASLGQTLVYESRTTRQTAGAAALTLTTAISRLDIGDRSGTMNLLRATYHPRDVIASGSMAGPLVDAVPPVPTTPIPAAGGVLEVWHDYTDPAQRDTRIAGANIIAPVATTDYTFNSQADGGGTNLTASVSVSATAFNTSAKFTITNNHATLAAYCTKLVLRGDGVYTLADAYVVASRGDESRAADVDLPYQDDPTTAQGIAELDIDQYLTPLVQTVGYRASSTSALRAAALAVDVGSRIEIAEPRTGIDRTVFVHGVEWVLDSGTWDVAYTVAPAPSTAWVLDTSALGSTTRLGV